MTRLVVHALPAGGLLVSGDDGRRWRLDASSADLDSAAVRTALATLRAGGLDAASAPGSDSARAVSSVDELRGTDAAGEVRWVFAGRPHRALLPPRDARRVAGDIADRLVASVANADEAHALAGPALLDEVTVTGAGRSSAPEPGVLERWTNGAWERHRLDPVPLVDPITGVLRRIVERPPDPAVPAGFVHLHAELPFLSNLDPTHQPDPLAPGGAFRGAAVSPFDEAVLSGIAHESGAYLGQGELRHAAADDLRAQGDRVLTVEAWVRHPDRLYDFPGFPFVRDDPSRRTWWLRGADRDGTRWAPLSIVHAGYLGAGLDGLLPTNGHNLVGLQAGFHEEDALDRAAAHLIAQDAVAAWWADGPALDDVALPEIVRDGWWPSVWDVRVLAVPSRFDVPVRLAVVDDAGDGIVALGYAADADPATAAERAVAEALVQHASARDLAAPSSLIRAATALGNGGVSGLAAHDPERRYVRAFGDRRGMVDPMCHVQYGLDPEVVARTRARVVPRGRGTAATSAGKSPFAALDASGEDWMSVDVTSARARAAGVHAIRILAPGLERLEPAAFDGASTIYPGW